MDDYTFEDYLKDFELDYLGMGEKNMAEIIDLYTADRELTGKTAGRGDALEKGTYRMVIHVCIFNSKGEMLIQKRADNIARWPSYWDVSVGGGAGAGDTSRVAAERETAEELGINIDFSDRRPVITVNFSDGFDDFYAVETDISLDDLHLQSEEVVDVRWASQEEVEAMIDDGSFIPYQKGLLGYLFFAREGRSTWDMKKD